MAVFQVMRMKVCYWREKVPGTYSADKRFPCFILTEGAESAVHIYGLPSHEYPGLVKVGRAPPFLSTPPSPTDSSSPHRCVTTWA